MKLNDTTDKIQELRLEIYIALEDVIKDICPIDRSETVKLQVPGKEPYVALYFDDNIEYRLYAVNENNEYVIKLSEENPVLIFTNDTGTKTFRLVLKIFK